MKLNNNNKVLFDSLTHSYFVGENELIGVTSLMKKHGLSPDYGGISENTLAFAAARGTAIHTMLEDYDNGEIVAQPLALTYDYDGVEQHSTLEAKNELKAYKELNLNVIRSEYLVSDNQTVATSIDKVLAVDGEDMAVDLADIKTTSKLHTDSLAWQLSICAYLFELQNPKIKVRNLYGVHVREGKAVKTLVNRIKASSVTELIECEREGKIFSSDDTLIPSLTLVVQEKYIEGLVETETEIKRQKDLLASLESNIKAFREHIYEYMLNNGYNSLHCDYGEYRITAPSTRVSIDSKRLKDEEPAIAEKYSKTSEVAGHVTFKPIN
ncbi:MAG: hypothetical protein WCS17_01780 [Prevotella sp.]